MLDLYAVENVEVPSNIKIKPGTQIADGLVVGKLLSHGIQGEVSLVDDESGNPTDWLVKVTFLRNAFDDMEREWITGRTLNLLQNSTFMYTGPALRSSDKVFRGMLLKKIKGTTCDKIVEDPKFHNIYWVKKCIYTVLLAMDEAQKVTGFHHYDLRLGNVMVEGENEEDWLDVDKARFKIIDFGLGAFDEGYALLPTDSAAMTSLLQRIKTQQQSEQRQQSMRKEPVDGQSDEAQRTDSNPFVTPLTLIRNTAMIPFKSQLSTKPSHESNSLPIPEAVESKFETNGDGAAIGEVTISDYSVVPFAKGDPIPQFVTSYIFKGYRQFWEHKGDLLYLCFSLSYSMDHRIWPKKDEVEVRRLMAFIHHVTGVHLKFKLKDNLEGVDTTKRARSIRNKWRNFCVKFKTFWAPYNSGITAAEGLCAPLFNDCRGNPYGYFPNV